MMNVTSNSGETRTESLKEEELRGEKTGRGGEVNKGKKKKASC